ncbi:baseplate J/gp47 family protein [Vogesella sp. AC12]|uniref:baseplate assembly protein n=1 Tax=Vogesella sp. AC12 TaxID=2950550 RepID=UPI00210DFF12|nr:baseplate J/gp47 family protein [Vogesella sp. AC12]MCQ4143219.1 baseplate J/gp47 family protein [Vogesella sp. AC12]
MIDLTQLPAPAVIEELDFETIYANKLARFQSLYPDYSAALESDPVVKLLELAAYDEMMLRARINDAAKASMLAYATGADLDNRAADYGVTRLLVTPADPDATPPIEAVWEGDDRLRYRCQLALEGLSVAGSRGAYLFHTLTASANVLHANIVSPQGGLVRAYILDRRSNGVPDQPLLDIVLAALSSETVIPLCDSVEVIAGQPLEFAVTATIEFEGGLIAATGGLPAAQARLETMLDERRKLAGLVSLDDIYGALKTTGIRRIRLTSPTVDIECGEGQFPQCTAINLS